LNDARSNEPGLDLGGKKSRLAFQVTSDGSSAKVMATLKQITPTHLATYDKIRVLIIGRKQGRYTLDPEETKRAHFSVDDIWDTNDLCRAAASLSIADLHDLHQIVSAECACVRVELEVRGPDGAYPTTLQDHIEKRAAVTRSDAAKYFASEAAMGIHDTQAEAQALLDELADALRELPRISREFFALLISKREVNPTLGAFGFRANADLIKRISRYPDTEGELRFLSDRGFIDYDPPFDHGRSPYWRILLPTGGKSSFYDAFFDYLNEAALDLNDVIVDLDFSGFGNPINNA
jgi:hypothetical protein